MWKLGSLITSVFVVGQLTGWEVTDLVAIALIVLGIGSWFWSQLSLRDLAVTRTTANDRLQVGELVRERFEIRNRGRLAKLWVEVADHSTLPGLIPGRVIHLKGRGIVRWESETRCLRRGRYRIGPLTLRAGDPFGLFPRRLTVPDSHEVVAYPAMFDLAAVLLPPGHLSGGQSVARHGAFATPHVAGIREYSPSDGFNRISWSATARLGRMMVKEFEIDPAVDAWIVLDQDSAPLVMASGNLSAFPPPLRYLDSTEEYGVAVAASVARYLLALGRSVGLIISGARVEVLPADRSERQVMKMLELLAVTRADGSRPLAETLAGEARRFHSHDTVLAISAATDERWADALGGLARRRVRTSAVVIDASSFGPAPSPQMVIARLAAHGVPTHIVRFGDDLTRSLAGESATAETGIGVRRAS